MKMKLVLLLLIPVMMMYSSSAQDGKTTAANDRAAWLQYLDKLAGPVLLNLAEDKLKEKLPLVLSERIDNKELRTKAAYLEAFGRTMTGIAPWLNLEAGTNEEVALRNKYRAWALKAI